jgi:hypothetical protein
MENLLNQTIKIYEKSTKPDKWGDQSWLLQCEIPCRFVKMSKQFVDPNGKAHQLDAMFQIQNHPIKEGNKIEYCNQEYSVDRIDEWRGGDGEIFGKYIECQKYKANG